MKSPQPPSGLQSAALVNISTIHCAVYCLANWHREILTTVLWTALVPFLVRTTPSRQCIWLYGGTHAKAVRQADGSVVATRGVLLPRARHIGHGQDPRWKVALPLGVGHGSRSVEQKCFDLGRVFQKKTMEIVRAKTGLPWLLTCKTEIDTPLGHLIDSQELGALPFVPWLKRDQHSRGAVLLCLTGARAPCPCVFGYLTARSPVLTSRCPGIFVLQLDLDQSIG